MFTGHGVGRIGRRGAAQAAALAALVAGACAAPPVQPPATRQGLERLAAAAHADIYGRPVALARLFAGHAVLYFFRTDCHYCAADLATARTLAARPGFPAVVLVSRESASRLRAALGDGPSPGLVVLSDSGGTLMSAALPTRFVPRVIAVASMRILIDHTGKGGAGLDAATAVTAADRQ
jgi:hypothetical protein